MGESKKLEIPENTLKLFIVRKPVNGIPKGFIHTPQLSPSLELFEKTQEKFKKNIFNKEEIEYLYSINKLNEEKSWWYLYERAFKKELNERPDMVKAVSKLKKLLTENKEIYLFCYCKDVQYCHRRIVGEFLEEQGFVVNYRFKEKESDSTEQLELF